MTWYWGGVVVLLLIYVGVFIFDKEAIKKTSDEDIAAIALLMAIFLLFSWLSVVYMVIYSVLAKIKKSRVGG